MPFPRKVWIGLLLPCTCKAGYRTGSQVKQRPWKDDMPSFLTQIFQDWGSRVSCVLTRVWDKETQGSLRKIWAWSEQEAVVFVCLLWWEAGPARLHVCRQDVTWGGVCSWEEVSGSLWCQLPGKFSLSPLPPTNPHGAVLGWWVQRCVPSVSFARQSISHPEVVPSGNVYLVYTVPFVSMFSKTEK